MAKSIRIKTAPLLEQCVAGAAKRLRIRPEDVWLLGAGEVTRYVERHGCITIPCVCLAPETGSVLRRAVSATGAFTHEADLAEHLLAAAVERFKAGDYSLIDNIKGGAA